MSSSVAGLVWDGTVVDIPCHSQGGNCGPTSVVTALLALV